MTSSTVSDCLSSLFCFLGFPGCIHSVEEHHSSAVRLGVFSQNVELRSVLRLLITRKETAIVNAWIKPCGGQLSFCCTVNAFPKKSGNLFCWKLCMRSVLSCASRRMKLRINGCFVSLARPCSVRCNTSFMAALAGYCASETFCEKQGRTDVRPCRTDWG